MNNSLLPCLARLSQLQHESVDRLAVQEAVEAASRAKSHREQLKIVADHLQVSSPRWSAAPDAAAVPALIHEPDGEWGILRGKNGVGQWVSEWWDGSARSWVERADDEPIGQAFAVFRLSRPYSAGASPVFQLIASEIFRHRKLIGEAVIGGLLINTVALAASFYTLQVYDRVVPTGASQTLMVLTLGVCLAIMFDLVAKRTRTGLYERLIDQVDQRLSRTVYMRFLAIRLDQLPRSVGGLAAQMRGYETVRGFLTAATSSLLVDAPFALLFVFVIYLIAGWLAAIPALFFVFSLATGWFFRRRIESYANKATAAANLKTGLLVETIEGAETIKSGQGGWRMLSRWMKTTDDAREYELRMRRISEHSQHLTAAFQQLSYVLLVASGALLISKGGITMGGLIACSILSGRVLAPVAMIPNQLVQWSHAKAALQGLDRLWALKDDHHGQDQPVMIENIRGCYRFESVAADYGGATALSVPGLVIGPGEKVGVMGPVGAGKTTFLRLLSGMYKPQAGRILLDDVDIAHISKPALAERVGYLPQDGRLFAGTLRDNLILGLIDPGDEAILQAVRETGLMQAVVARHPRGLQQEIFEGGTGLSGGQKQLVNLTRVFLRNPVIWLLDEPTASLDRNLELQVISALWQEIGPEDTLILVTHKGELLELVDRLIVIANGRIVMDGPKAQVLMSLQAPQPVEKTT